MADVLVLMNIGIITAGHAAGWGSGLLAPGLREGGFYKGYSTLDEEVFVVGK